MANNQAVSQQENSEPILISIAGAVIAVAIGVFANWTTRPQWAEDHPQRVIAAVVALALVGALLAVGADWLTDKDARRDEATPGRVPPATPVPTMEPPVTEEPTRTTDPPATTPTQEPPPTEFTPPPSQPSWTLAWEERVLLPKVAGLELDSDPPQPVNGADGGADLRYSNDEALGMKLYAGPAFTEPSGEGMPDADACYRALLSFPLYSADPSPGQIFCVGTSEGRVARLQVERAEYEGVVFRATVWSSAD